MYLGYIHSFRGLAIVYVVLGHCFALSGVSDDYWGVWFNVISGGTVLFVFISGYLFEYVFCNRFNYRVFIRKKFLHVFVPYVFMSAPALLYVLWKNESTYFPSYSDYGEMASYAASYFFNGRMITGYWFVPFVFVVFLLAPVWRFLASFEYVLVVLSVVGVFLASIVHRPYGNIGVFHNLVYYLPVFWVGMVVSKKSDSLNSFFSDYWWVFSLGVVLLLLVQTWGQGHLGQYRKSFFEYSGFDLQIFQKLFVCFSLVGLLQVCSLFERFWGFLADNSFGIYFVHVYFVFLLKYAFEFYEVSGWLAFGLGFVFCMLASLLVVVSAKGVFGRYSRYIVGS
ncbi:acyltransferase family protein [Oceanobacter kriegii]|uniref:acyltransferase family protein n=1 Tax=Oceanobacter kriegii TaxID=64972 RepID=UPI0003FE8CDC|nr:acyltransferase [Oceanobacter kriegii]